MKRKVKLFLYDMIENMKMAEDLTSGIEYQTFIADKTRHYAVLRCIEIIGEASKHITDEIRSANPLIPWKEMAGMRDKLIHDYFGVNLRTVWDTVKKDIPDLKPKFEQIYRDFAGKEAE